MFSDETKQTVYIALSLILLASVLGLCSVVIHLRGDLATSRNDEIATAKNMAIFREFNKYNNTVIYGEDIVELVSRYKGTDIEIYVDKVGGGTPFHITKASYKANPAEYEVLVLQNLFNPNFKYNAYLVYDMDDVTVLPKIYDPSFTGSVAYYTEVTGIHIKWVGIR